MNLREIARLAGLSLATVSLALRDSPKISLETRRRVRLLADKHGYRSDARIVSMMTHLRQPRAVREQACLGVMSLYDDARPWTRSAHLERIHIGMKERAAELGYRIEPFWLRAPGMSDRRLNSILFNRGVEGILCLGSPNIEEDFPSGLTASSIVTVGLSIRTRMHRVINDAAKDMMGTLQRLHGLGYRRIGLVIDPEEDALYDHAHVSAYLGWCDFHLGLDRAGPILRMSQFDTSALTRWLRKNRFEAIVVVHNLQLLETAHQVLRQQGHRIPDKLGLAGISPILKGTPVSGMEQTPRIMGRLAVELLVGRMANRDTGLPRFNRVEMVHGTWVDGQTLRSSVNS